MHYSFVILSFINSAMCSVIRLTLYNFKVMLQSKLKTKSVLFLPLPIVNVTFKNTFPVIDNYSISSLLSLYVNKFHYQVFEEGKMLWHSYCVQYFFEKFIF